MVPMRHGVWFAVVVGLAGCGGSQAPSSDAGGCGLELAICSVGCAQETPATVCQNGVWQCPAGLTLETPATCPSSTHFCEHLLLPVACSCDPTTGALSCDGGTSGAACPAEPNIRRADGTIFTCVPEGCPSDAAVRPICLDGGLACPAGSGLPANVCLAPTDGAAPDTRPPNG